jgi:ATP-dependent RNA helicase RhlB
VYGGIDYRKQRDDLAEGVDMLIGTPGRLIDYLKQKVYSLKKTQFLVIDEADRMFDMGFIADLRFMLKRMSPYNERQSMLFSATLSHRVMELAHEYMNMPEHFVVTPKQVTVDAIEQEIYHVGTHEKVGFVLGLIRRVPEGRFLIFCNMKVTADRLMRTLEANGISAASITGDLDQKKRLKVLADFKEGMFPVLIATDVASRGLHIDAVTHVVNYDLPQDAEDYVHRIGRTGRAGADGKAISLGSEDYIMALPEIEAFIKKKIPVVPVTDEMIVMDYKKVAGGHRRKADLSRQRYERKPDRKPDRRERGPKKPAAVAGTPPATTPDTPKTASDKPRRRRNRGGKKPGTGNENQTPDWA